MLITVRSKLSLRICEIYFAEDCIAAVPDADVVIYIQVNKQIDGCREFITMHINLNETAEEIFSRFSKNNQEKVKRARNRVEYHINATLTDDDIYEFSNFYNCFAASKGICKCNIKKLKSLRDKNALVITSTYEEEGIPLCTHAYIADGQRARCLYSASHFRISSEEYHRNLIGYSNRYLHWMDINYFKEQGYEIYDFGGLTLDENNKAMKAIDNFKMSFGGRVVREYLLYQPVSLKGKLALRIMRS